MVWLPSDVEEVTDSNAIKITKRWSDKDTEEMHGLAVYHCRSRNELDKYPFDRDFSSLVQPIGVSYYYYTLDSNNQVSEALVDYNIYFGFVQHQRVISEGPSVVDKVSEYLNLIKKKGWDLEKVVIVTIRLHLYHIMIYEGVSYVIKDNKLVHLNKLLKRDKEYFDLFFSNLNLG